MKYKPPLDKNDMMLRQLQLEDYMLPYTLRIIPIKVEADMQVYTRPVRLPTLPRTAIVRNMFIGAVETIAKEAISFIHL